jgi:hypothetical protein
MEGAPKHLEQVTFSIRKHQFYAKNPNVSFGKEEVEYLRTYNISRKESKVDPNKIKAIRMAQTKEHIQTKRILGLIGIIEDLLKTMPI